MTSAISVGDRFGRWVVLGEEPPKYSSNGPGRSLRREQVVLCRCDCGTSKAVFVRNLRRGLSTSCGCFKLERLIAAKRASRSATPSYDVAHTRVKRDRGAAREHLCPCGAQAKDWAYDHRDPNPLTEDYLNHVGKITPLTYSADVNHYIAMCRPCHGRFDSESRKARACI